MGQTIKEIVNSKEYKQEEEKRWNKEILLKFELPKAIETLCKTLKEDKDYYNSWQTNIAMAFKDEFNTYPMSYRGQDGVIVNFNQEFIHKIANDAAHNFLKLLTK